MSALEDQMNGRRATKGHDFKETNKGNIKRHLLWQKFTEKA